MRHRLPSALLVGTALVLGTVASPGLAFADGTATATGTTTTITPTEAGNALKAAQAASVTAGHDGWSERLARADAKGAHPSTIAATYAMLEGRGYMAISDDGTAAFKELDVQHTGSYYSLVMLTRLFSFHRLHRILNVIGHPDATWVYIPDKTVSLSETGITTMGPGVVLGRLVDPYQTTITGTPTKTVAADGTTTYDLDVVSSDLSDSGTMTVTVDPAGAVSSYADQWSTETDSATFAYGPQHIALPKWGHVVTVAKVMKGVPLLTMAPDTRKIVNGIRSKVANEHHRAGAAVGLIRAAARSLVQQRNHADHETIFTAHWIKNGVRVRATNPFTHTQVTWTAKADGKQVVLHRL